MAAPPVATSPARRGCRGGPAPQLLAPAAWGNIAVCVSAAPVPGCLPRTILARGTLPGAPAARRRAGPEQGSNSKRGRVWAHAPHRLHARHGGISSTWHAISRWPRGLRKTAARDDALSAPLQTAACAVRVKRLAPAWQTAHWKGPWGRRARQSWQRLYSRGRGAATSLGTSASLSSFGQSPPTVRRRLWLTGGLARRGGAVPATHEGGRRPQHPPNYVRPNCRWHPTTAPTSAQDRLRTGARGPF